MGILEEYEMTEAKGKQLEQAAEHETPGTRTLTFLREVSARYSGPRRKLVTIREARNVKDFLDGILKNDAREHFFTLFLNGSHEVVCYATTSIGTANATLVHAREVFQPAILSGAVAVVVAHNHPSGNCEPSSEDRIVTKQLRDAGDLLGIRLLDHVIITTDSYRSFAENGEL
jgi:DNA repair protein RadC